MSDLLDSFQSFSDEIDRFTEKIEAISKSLLRDEDEVDRLLETGLFDACEPSIEARSLCFSRFTRRVLTLKGTKYIVKKTGDDLRWGLPKRVKDRRFRLIHVDKETVFENVPYEYKVLAIYNITLFR
jgi:hypothetical protein